MVLQVASPPCVKGIYLLLLLLRTVLEVNSLKTLASSQLLSPADYALAYYNALSIGGQLGWKQMDRWRVNCIR